MSLSAFSRALIVSLSITPSWLGLCFPKACSSERPLRQVTVAAGCSVLQVNTAVPFSSTCRSANSSVNQFAFSEGGDEMGVRPADPIYSSEHGQFSWPVHAISESVFPLGSLPFHLGQQSRGPESVGPCHIVGERSWGPLPSF